MEIMEDGNLMDKVHILIQRDMEYYGDKQTVLQENVCPGVVGGRLDFPRSASFAATKLVQWWEEEYVAAYRKNSGFLPKNDGCSDVNKETSVGDGGMVKASDPTKFVELISKSADEFLEHLHVLTQEALDHADLTVLTGTIGAAALLKNCLWFYIQQIDSKNASLLEILQNAHRKYQEMVEALAERLLDLHCRLLSLYVLQDADSLDWENDRPFCESERGSYIVQMWWLYMQGTKDDLWNTVPPRMAQRIFSGMLNESLTILTVRYIQSGPSEARSQLLVVDISNVLLCVAQLLPSISDNGAEYVGCSLNDKSKILRDIHTKCEELLFCLLMRGSSLDDLEKIFRKGLDKSEIIKTRTNGPLPWITFALPQFFKEHPKRAGSMDDLPENTQIALELSVLLAQPQPNWSLFLKLLTMKNFKILKWILENAMENFQIEMQKPEYSYENCGAFLCPSDGTCNVVDTTVSFMTASHHYDLILAATSVVLCIGNEENLNEILIRSITKEKNWNKCFDKRHVWNQIRPPWYEAMLDLLKPLLSVITKTVINAVQTGATMYQAMLIILLCFTELWDCSDLVVTKIATLIQDVIPVDTIPLNHSILIQIVISALYSALLHESVDVGKRVKFKDERTTQGEESMSGDVALAIAEALCAIDEDDKHTDQMNEFSSHAKLLEDNAIEYQIRDTSVIMECRSAQVMEILASDILMTTNGRRSLKILFHFMKNNSRWLYQKLEVCDEQEVINPNRVLSPMPTLLHTMFHIGGRPFDQLLTNEWKIHWTNLLQIPMGLCVERVWKQISLRWEFKDINSSTLTTHDQQIIHHLTTLFKQL